MTTSLFQWHEHPRLLSAATTTTGQVVVWGIATGLLFWNGVTTLMPISLALVLVYPSYRHRIVSIAAAAAVCEHFITRKGDPIATVLEDPANWLLPALQIVGILLGLYLSYWLAQRFRSWPKTVQRYPVLALHIGSWTALGLTGLLPAIGVLVEIVPWLIWRISYLIQFASRGRAANTSFSDHLMYLWPVFGGNQPFGKGLEYLGRHEVTTSLAITKSQVSGIKLLALAILWNWVILLLDTLVLNGDQSNDSPVLTPFTSMSFLVIPRLADAISNQGITTGAAWASLYIELIRATLVIAVRGHVIVGCLRLLGFNVFRNTYKPLLSETILDFWNRFNYYFKELMVEFFFYPSFLRTSWAGEKLRLFIAVFAAAFVGNMYFHVLLYPGLLLSGDLDAIWSQWGARLVYCFLLAAGVWLSMLRQQRRRKEVAAATLTSRSRAIAGVCTFYAVLHIWNVRLPEAAISARLDFCLRLIGL